MTINSYLPIIIGAIIGYLTNWVAIKFLFWPKTKKLGFQGAIPKNKERLAGDLAKISVKHIFTGKQISEIVEEKFSEDNFLRMMSGLTPEFIKELNKNENKEKVAKLIIKHISSGNSSPLVSIMINETLKSFDAEKALEPHEEALNKKLCEKLYPILKSKITAMSENFIPDDLIEDKIRKTINLMDENKLERLILEVVKNELILIKWSGAVLGSIIGLIQVVLF